MPGAARYPIRVTWSREDDEFVATCIEFPSLSWLDTTPEAAMAGLRRVIDEVVNDLQASSCPTP